MLGVIRRKVASKGLSATVLGQSVHRTQPVASMPRCYMALQNEPLHLEKGSEPAQKISYRCFLGGRAYIKPNREVATLQQTGCLTRTGSRPFSSDNVVPFMGESISDGTLANFLKKSGHRVEVHEPTAQIVETDKGMNFAEIEKEINTLAKKATDGSIAIDEMAGGTLNISNGGVNGSLLSTPIINPPQSATLGRTGTEMSFLRPLSPHLPIYQPQLTSTFSILNRISGSFLAAFVLSFYLIYLKMGLICFTYENFYQFLLYSSKLTLISFEISALALSYHLYIGVRHALK